MIKICPVCQKEFKIKLSRANTRICCSMPCANEYKKTALRGANNPNYRGRECACITCGKVFGGYVEGRKHCSRECRAVTQSKTPRHKTGKLVQANFLKQCGFRWCVCPKCDKKFQHHRSGEKFCSKCAPPSMYYKRCTTCKKEFTTPYHNRKYCGRKCYNAAIAIRQKGERSHRWKGGLTNPDRIQRNSMEYADWRKAVFARDDFTCQLCFERGGKLAAHHIREYAKHKELRTHLGNGITLCWPCHRSIKRKERIHESTFYDITGGIR